MGITPTTQRCAADGAGAVQTVATVLGGGSYGQSDWRRR